MRWGFFYLTTLEEIKTIKKFNYLTDGRVDAVDVFQRIFEKECATALLSTVMEPDVIVEDEEPEEDIFELE